MEELAFFKLHGANWSHQNNVEDETKFRNPILSNVSYRNMVKDVDSPDYSLPEDLTQISSSSLFGVFVYFVVFLVAIFGQIFALRFLWKRFKVKKTRIYLLLLHLSLADLSVCLIIVPTEIFWRLSVQWEGGNILCKATQFCRAFGLYLSSLILVCLSVDRFISIVFPLNAIGTNAYKRIKWMLATAWITAAIFSFPQTIFFNVEYHPRYPNYKQCVTSAFHDEESFHRVKIYSVFSLVIMYFVPLCVISLTYSIIFIKLAIQSRDQFTSSLVHSDAELPHENSMCSVMIELGEISPPGMKPTFHLRASNNAQQNLARAKMKTLLMTIVIIIAFLVCWTPYAIMTIWYIVDWEVAEQVDPRIQDAFFLMVVANSCINPFIYGGFSQRTRI